MPAQSYDEMMKSFVDTQKKMWDTLFDSVPGSGKSETAKAWEQFVSMGEQTLKNTLKSQSELIEGWVKTATGTEGAPPAIVDSAKQFQETFARWSEAQERVWTGWFEMLKGFDPDKAMGAWPVAPGNPFQMWQDESRKMIDRQLEWMRSWTGQTRS